MFNVHKHEIISTEQLDTTEVLERDIGYCWQNIRGFSHPPPPKAFCNITKGAQHIISNYSVLPSGVILSIY
jgi:hypothetical protein